MKPLIVRSLRNCRKAISFGPLQQSVLEFFVNQVMTVSDSQDYLELYFIINKSAKGELSPMELIETFWEYGIMEASTEEVLRIFSMVDGDNSGLIDFGEFTRICTSPKEMIRKEKVLKNFFFKIDFKKNDYFTFVQFKNLMISDDRIIPEANWKVTTDMSEKE